MEGNESSSSSTLSSRPTYTGVVSNGSAHTQIVNNNKEQLTGVNQNHAIVIDPIDGVTGHQYSKAVAEVVGNKTVTHVGRKSGKVILYLKDTTFVTQVINSGIGVAGQHVNVTPLTSQSKRVVISNVNPDIPNQLLRSYLKRYGEISTSVFPLSAGFKDELSHVLSLRRACRMFLKDEYQQLDTSFDFPYNGQNHRVFVAVDGLMCFYCKKRNHIRANCPELQYNEVSTPPPPRTEGPSTSTDDGFTIVQYKKGPKNKHRAKTLRQAAANVIAESHDDESNDAPTDDNSTDNSTDNDKITDDNLTEDNSTEINITADLTTDVKTNSATNVTRQNISNVNLTKICETASNTAQGLKQKHRFDYDKNQLVSEHIQKSIETKTVNLPISTLPTATLPTVNLPTTNVLTTDLPTVNIIPATVICTTAITESNESDGTGNPQTPVPERESRSRSHSPGERKKRRVSLEKLVEDLDMKVDPHGDPGPPVSEAARFLRSDSMTSISSVSSWSSVNSEDVTFTEESKLDDDLLPTQKERQEVMSFIISVKKKKNIESRVETAFPNIKRFLDVCESMLSESGLDKKLRNRIKRIVCTLNAYLKTTSLS